MLSSASHEHLQQRAIQGDAAAVARLLIHYSDRLLRRIRRRMPAELRGLDLEGEILHDCYIRAFRHIGSFQPRSTYAFYAWLAKIADRRLIDVSKRLLRETPRGRTGRRSDSWNADSIERLSGKNSSVGGGAIRNEGLRALQVAIAALPEQYRRVLVLRYLDEQPLERIARKLSISEAAVRGLLHRAKRQLREFLGSASAYFDSK